MDFVFHGAGHQHTGVLVRVQAAAFDGGTQMSRTRNQRRRDNEQMVLLMFGLAIAAMMAAMIGM